MLYERVLAAAAAVPWAIEPARGEVLLSVLERRVNGGHAPASDLEWAREIAAERSRRKAQPRPGGVCLIPVYGIMTQRADMFDEISGMVSTDRVGQQVDDAAADPTVEAIVLDIDSPGGSVYGVEQLALKLQAASGKKKVIAVADSVAASGAYWVASNAGELVVTPDGEVGSVGVYMLHTDVSRAMDAAGVKLTYVKAGKNKTAGNPYEPLGPDGAAELQAGVDDYYDLFVRAVARGRGVPLSRVREGFGQGGMVRAKQAVADGMVDRVATLGDVLSRYGVTPRDLAPDANADRPELEIRHRRLRMD